MNKEKGTLAFLNSSLAKIGSYKIFIIFTLFVVSFTTLQAQNFPVDVNLQVLPPQSPVFHTYSQSQAIQTNKIFLSANLKDLVVPSLDIGLRFEFRGPNGTFSTDQSLINLPFTIQQGVPLMLSNDDLSAYFLSPELSQSITDANGFMAEGDWEICVTAYELLNQEQVSRQTCFYMFLENYDPPEIIQPFDSILPSFPQNIQTSWQPLHIGAFPVRYNVEIWEALEGFTDQQIVDLTPPYYYKTVDQITSTFLTAFDLPLSVGSEYLMRVQVEDNVNGPMGLPAYVFKNQGFSNLHRFKYGMVIDGQECLDPTVPDYVVDDSLDMYVFWNDGEPPTYTYEAPSNNVNTTAPSSIMSQGIGLSSSSGGGATSLGYGGGSSSSSGSSTQSIYSEYYKLYYRDITDGIEGEWSVIETENKWALFEDYTRGHEYEIYVSVVCSAEERSSESIFVKFSTLPEARDFSCGMPALEIDLSQQRPLASLAVDDTIIAGDMRVIILDVQGANGYFSGSGYMKPPVFGARIGLTFNNIFVNNEYRMVDGEMKTMYDPTGGNIIDVSGWKDFFPGNDEPFPIIQKDEVSDADFKDGKVTIYPGGDEYEAPIRVQTPDGDVILSGGMIIREVDVDLPSQLASSFKGEFSISDIHRYGFDQVDPKLIKSYDDFGGIALDNKSIARGGSDFLTFTLKEVPDYWTAASIDSLRIISEENFEFEYEKLNDKEIKIKMPGLEGLEQVYIIKGEECLGGFNLSPYQKTVYKVNLIPVNGAGLDLKASDIQTQVNSILKQGVVSVEVNLLSDQGVSDDLGVIQADTDVLDAYSDHMKSILQSHLDQYGQEENEMYLFLVDDIEGSVVGAMPEGMNAGFVKVGQSPIVLARTVAHELGHGAFTLEHFWKKTDYEKNQSENLMDYKGGNDLVIKQWNRMHQQKFPLPWFRKAEDGQYVTIGFEELFKPYVKSGYIHFLSNTGEIVSIESEKIEQLTFATGGETYVESQKQIPIGTLTYFTLKDSGKSIKYANYGNGKYYVYPKGDALDEYLLNYEGVKEPIILRPTLKNGKDAVHIVQLSQDHIIESNDNTKFDFLLEKFYTISENSFSLSGQVINIKPTDNYNLGAEFRNSLYLEVIAEFPAFAQSERLTSFYLNGLAFFLNSNSEYFKSCNSATQLKAILIKLLNLIEDEQAKLNNTQFNSITGRPYINVNYTQDLCKLLGFFTRNFQNEQNAAKRLSDFFIILDRKNLVQKYQDEIDQFNTNPSQENLQYLKRTFKSAYGDLENCEFDQLKVSYDVIESLVGFMVMDDHFWVNNREEKVIVNLLEKITSDRHDDFLTYMRNKKTTTIYDEDGTMYNEKPGYTIVTNWLWNVMIERVDNSMFDSNGKSFILELGKIWNGAAQTVGRKTKLEEKVTSDIDNLLNSSSESLDFEEFRKIAYQVVPFSYTPFLNRINWYYVLLQNPALAYPLTPITNVSINETDGSFNAIIQNKVLFFVENAEIDKSFMNLDPFEPIIVDNNSSFGTATEILKEGDFSVYPAFLIYYLHSNAERRTQSDVIFTAIDFASLFIPGGAVAKLSKIGKVMVFADKISAVAGIAATYHQDKNKDAAGILNATSAILGLSVLGNQAIATLTKSSTNPASAFKLISPKEVEDLSNPILRNEKLEGLFDKVEQAKGHDIIDIGLKDRAIIKALIESEAEEIVELGGTINAARKANVLAKLSTTVLELTDDAIGLGTGIARQNMLATLADANGFERIVGNGVEDVIVHSNGTKFLVDGIEHSVESFSEIIGSGNGPLRLLSCNDLSSAEQIATFTGRPVIANGGYTKIHIDGGITVKPRPSNGDANWYQIQPNGNKSIYDFPNSITKYADDFIELGLSSQLRGFSALCPPGFITRFDNLGINIDDVKIFFKAFDDDVLKVEKLLNVLENFGDPTNLGKLVADLKKSEGKELLLKIGKGEDGQEFVKSWKIAEKLPPNLRLNPDILDEITRLSAKQLDGKPLDVAKLFNNGFDDVLKNLDEAEVLRRLKKMDEWEPKWINDLANKLAKPEKYPGLAEMLKKDDVFEVYNQVAKDPLNAVDIVKKFDANDEVLEKLGGSFFFQELMKKGKDFELAVLSNIRKRIGSEYNALKKLVTDLDQRKLLTQVQFCVPGLKAPCKNKGEYFIADQVWVKYDEFGDVVDMVIVDTKLSKATDFTTGQQLAKNHINGKINYKASETMTNDIDNALLPGSIKQDSEIKIKGFFKAYGDGDKTFLNIL